MKIKHLRNGKITLSFTDIRIPYQSLKFLTSQIRLLMLFAKIKFSRQFPNLQYYSYKRNLFFQKASAAIINDAFKCLLMVQVV